MFDAAINRDTNNLVAAVLGADGVRQGCHSKLPQ